MRLERAADHAGGGMMGEPDDELEQRRKAYRLWLDDALTIRANN